MSFKKCYFFQIVLKFCAVKKDHNDYPLAPEQLKINDNMLSNYCSNIANDYGLKIDSVNKLVPNLGSKSKYVLYYKNLQLYLSLGMKLTKVNRILKFKQLGWLKIYIDFNTDERKMLLKVLKRIFLNL